MEFICKVLHPSEVECNISVAEQLWRKLSAAIDVTIDNKFSTAMCKAQAVFMYCQKSLVPLKEGETLLLESERCTSVEEADLDIDETALL